MSKVNKNDKSSLEFKEKMVSVNRVTKVVKGGRVLAFAALAVVGDGDGGIGMGKGKAKEVPAAVAKAMEEAKKTLVKVNLVKGNSNSCHCRKTWCCKSISSACI